jgi:Zn-dependent protease
MRSRRALREPVRIVLYALGGLTYHNAMSRGRSLAVTLAGPLSGLAAGGLVYAFSQGMAPLHGSVEVAVRYALWINIAWSLINLLPVLPLDGGQALRSGLHIVTGVVREALVRQISIGVAIGGGILAFRAGLTFTALFALFFVGDNFKALRDTKTNAHVQRLRSVDAADSGGGRRRPTKCWPIVPTPARRRRGRS